MKNLFLALSMLFFVMSAYSQSMDEPISVVKKKKFYQEEQRLTNSELKYILTNNPVSTSSYLLARRNANISSGFVIAGLGIAIVGILYGGIPVMLVGLGVEVIGLPFAFSSRNHLLASVNQHNMSLGQSGGRNVSFELMSCATGVGFRVRF